MNEKQIFTNILEEEIIDSKDISEEEKRKLLKTLFILKSRKNGEEKSYKNTLEEDIINSKDISEEEKRKLLDLILKSRENEEEKGFINELEKDITNSKDIPEEEKKFFFSRLFILKKMKTNVMITGATGCGKSSTINALFKTEKAKVGVGVDPETMDITKYELDNLILWDSPGLGDGKEADKKHARNIIEKLKEKNRNGEPLIDLVLVIVDGGTRDLGTSYDLINEVIIPNLGERTKERILVAINRADMAMQGEYWNKEGNYPEDELKRFLDEKVTSIKNRIKDSTGLDVEPIYYSAGYTNREGRQTPPYNLSKLLYYILNSIQKSKRLSFVNNMNKDEENWEYNDKSYRKGILEHIWDSICGGVESTGGAIAGAVEFTGSAIAAVAGRAMDFFRGRF